jgi:hypothetical protein
MARLKPSSNTVMREYVGPVALGVAMAVCMPLIGVAAFMMRGVLVGVVAAAIAAVVSVSAWHILEPSLSLKARAVLRTYAAPVGIAVAMLVSLPLLAVVGLVVQGTAAALAAAGLVMMGIVGAAKLVIVLRHTGEKKH